MNSCDPFSGSCGKELRSLQSQLDISMKTNGYGKVEVGNLALEMLKAMSKV